MTIKKYHQKEITDNIFLSETFHGSSLEPELCIEKDGKEWVVY